MEIVSTDQPLAQHDSAALAVGLWDESPLTGPAAELDRATGGLLARLREAKEVSTAAGEVTTLLGLAGMQGVPVVTVGLGERSKLDRGTAFRAAAAAAKALAAKPRATAAFYLGDDWPEALVADAICGALVGCTGQDLYRREKNRHPFERIRWQGATAAQLERGRVLGESVNLTRRLVNEPPQNLYPQSFADAAREVAARHALDIEVWDEHQLEAERCGALLAVGRGSARKPRLVILRHAGGGPDDPWLGLVGKGVTFDSGGLSLKPTDGMVTMKCDMAGAATVLGAMQAIARLKLPLNVLGFAGLVENLLGGECYKLGDVLTARSGKTIEVLNTDAEGRLVLADVLDVAVERKVDKLIDLATLTGACVVALGTDVAGLMTNDAAWGDRVQAAAQACGEPVWPLPMFPEYGKQIKSEIADIKNTGDGRWGGAITAAKFLEEFVAGAPWVHLDIAGPAYYDKPKSWIDGGGSGAMVRTLVEVAEGWTGK